MRDNAPLVVQSENGELGAARQDQGQGLKRRVLRGIMESIGCSEILANCVPVRAGGDGSEAMLELAELPRDAILEAFQDAAEQLGERVIAMIEAWRTDARSRVEHGIAGGSGGKFVEGQYGGLEMFHMGPNGLSTTKFSPSNNKDIMTSDAEEWALMVIEDEHGAAVGVSNKDRAGNVMCADFTQHEMAIKAKLSLAEIIALRLYTGPEYNLSEAPFAHAPQDEGFEVFCVAAVGRVVAQSRIEVHLTAFRVQCVQSTLRGTPSG